MKTKYCIIEPGPLRDQDLVSLPWVDIELATEARKVDHGPDAPEQVPTYLTLKRMLDPLFPGRNFEHVAVNSFKGRADMFVDDMGMADGHPVNEAATLIYWTASILREMDAAGGIEAPEEYQARQLEALRLARSLLPKHRPEVPRIHGRAVLFDGRVWF